MFNCPAFNLGSQKSVPHGCQLENHTKRISEKFYRVTDWPKEISKTHVIFLTLKVIYGGADR